MGTWRGPRRVWSAARSRSISPTSFAGRRREQGVGELGVAAGDELVGGGVDDGLAPAQRVAGHPGLGLLVEQWGGDDDAQIHLRGGAREQRLAAGDLDAEAAAAAQPGRQAHQRQGHLEGGLDVEHVGWQGVLLLVSALVVGGVRASGCGKARHKRHRRHHKRRSHR